MQCVCHLIAITDEMLKSAPPASDMLSHFLILGNNDYCSAIKDGKSSKQKKPKS